MEGIKNNIIRYIINCDGDAHFNHLIKLGCTKRQAAVILQILSRSEFVDLYDSQSEISLFLEKVEKEFEIIIYTKGNYTYYINRNDKELYEVPGKWACYGADKNYSEKICRESVEKGVVTESKHSNESVVRACFFYCDYDDIDAHKRIISYFLENNLIRKTKTGKLYDISFKLDIQTDLNIYGKKFEAFIKLSEFVDLKTGKFIDTKLDAEILENRLVDLYNQISKNL